MRISILLFASWVFISGFGGKAYAAGGSARESRVTICHIPPGNPENAHTITVGQAAVSAHLQHGDYLGECQACRPEDGCICVPNSNAPCYEGPAGTEGVGTCMAGTHVCNSNGTSYGACTDAVEPVTEICGDGLDNDCDGTADDGCLCVPNSNAPCYEGPAGTEGVGTCAAGTHVCNSSGTSYGACTGAVEPVAEVCGDGLDNDCDGTADDGCLCIPGSSAPCYGGPAGTEGFGICTAGTQVCDSSGMSYGACTGAVEPVAEVCGDGLDNDCDGTSDDGCLCAPGSSSSCYSGPSGTEGIGTCAAGTHVCDSSGMSYGVCTGAVEPVAEVCGDGLDNNCDGTVDDGCCVPTTEVCGDGVDNDCNGTTDNGCIGDFAWRDLAINGIQEAGEPGIANVVFTLYTEGGAFVQSAVSDSSGIYHFSGVPAGAYYITVSLESLPPPPPFQGWGITNMDAGDDALDSDFDGEGLATPSFLFDGTSITNIDCGVFLGGGA